MRLTTGRGHRHDTSRGKRKAELGIRCSSLQPSAVALKMTHSSWSGHPRRPRGACRLPEQCPARETHVRLILDSRRGTSHGRVVRDAAGRQVPPAATARSSIGQPNRCLVVVHSGRVDLPANAAADRNIRDMLVVKHAGSASHGSVGLARAEWPCLDAYQERRPGLAFSIGVLGAMC